MSHVRTTCPYCGVGCGVLAQVENAQVVSVQGDPQHPANFGKLCSKGSALHETLDTHTRLGSAKIGGVHASVDQATTYVANQIKHTLDTYGPDAVMFYVSGQLLTEDYYVANKLIKGFIGSNHIDSNSRLCMSSAVVGHKRAFGSDTVPVCYEDLEACDMLVITGSNMAWCHPILFQRVRASHEGKRKKIIVIDPRKTDSAALADLHLPLKPGSDVLLWNGLLRYLNHGGFLSEVYKQNLSGLEACIEACEPATLTAVAQGCELSEADVLEFYSAFSEHEKVITAFCMGINQSSSGSDKASSIINAHLFTGKIGSSGMGPFSLTGQPNAMGGREVGALSNLLAAHFDLKNQDHRKLVGEFWQAPKLIGPDTGVTAAEVASSIESGRIKFLWVMSTNPAASLTKVKEFKEAVKHLDCLVVSDCIEDTATTRLADVLLPAAGWSEKSGTVTNSERRISRQRALVPAFKDAQPDWKLICTVAQKLGFNGFDFANEHEVFVEHAALSNLGGQRSFRLGALANLTFEQYHSLEPIQWPVHDTELSCSSSRLFAAGNTDHGHTKAALVPLTPHEPQSKVTNQYPYVLNTGRIRDQWHTMTRTGLSPRLNEHLPEPFLQIHPSTAAELKIKDADLVQVSSAQGELVVPAKLTTDVRTHEVFAPMHWSIQSKRSCVGDLIDANLDPDSMQPEFKITPVSLKPLQVSSHGFLLLEQQRFERFKPVLSKLSYFSYRRMGQVVEVSFKHSTEAAKLAAVFELDQLGQVSVFADPAQNLFKAAAYDSKANVLAVLHVADLATELVSTRWIRTQFEAPLGEAAQRMALMAGRPLEGDFDVGRIICSCFTVGEKTIRTAIEKQKLCTAEQIGACLKAGTNCGSCVPELKKILASS